ncbi:DUF916 and DUF3324 domain-containing protein [Pediococcus siamensis]|uniref:DUF916 and DUF3324 domain-containing protein n=1 Tax=Pediococcus siamensis TaxID=381829 RepID=UPI0039A04709
MFRKLIQFFLLVTIVITGGLFTDKTVRADEATFTVSRIASKQQNDTSVSYFDLKLKPNQTTQIQVKVTNLSNQTLHLIASPNTGYTTDSGTVAYDLKKLGSKSTAPYQLETILGGQQKVTVPAKGSKVVTFPIKMPATPFKGVLDGALYFLNPKTSQTTATNKKNFTIKNRYALALGVTIHEDTQTTVLPKLKLGTIKTGTAQADKFSPAIQVNVINSQAALAKKLHITSQVSKDGKTLYKTNTKNLTMAADSNFDYAITTNHAALQAGTYHLHMVARSGRNAGLSTELSRFLKPKLIMQIGTPTLKRVP